MSRRVIVVGGGAAGMLAAISARRSGAAVTICEKNEKLGKKIYITGKGRCNLTNACDIEDFFDKIPTNPKFLMSALHTFTNQDIIALINAQGVPTKVERGGRVFPESDKSSDILRALERILKKEGVAVRLHTTVEEIMVREGRAVGVVAGGDFLAADAVILATGGRSYPLTGSTGDGYRFAEQTGHRLTQIRPSLIPMVLKQGNLLKEAAGLSLKNVRLTLKRGEKEVYSDQGEMLLTHFGISGPLVLSASAHITKGEPSDYTVWLDLKPALSEKQLDARILRDFAEQQNKQLKNALFGLLPRNMVNILLALSGVDGEKQVNAITKEERAKLVDTMQHMRFDLTALRSIDEAIVTRGGVSVKDISPKTMESKKIPGLYFAGELIDVDGYTGGYNLQIAFSTGWLAGKNAGNFDVAD